MLKLHAVKESSVVEILNRYDWYFLPVANPDGYEYSHQNGVSTAILLDAAMLPLSTN